MDKPDPKLLREMPQQFDHTAAAGAGKGLGLPRRVKVFKSGNSLAVRMPKGLGLEAGTEMELELQSDGALILRSPAPAKQKLDISGFWGKAKGLKVPERRDFEERPSAIAARMARGDE